MARLTDQLLGQEAWNAGRDIAMLNPGVGGAWGYAANPAEWLGAQGYLPRNLIPIVLETPRFFQLMPNPAKWVEAWKLFFEKHARTIEGLKAGLTVETAEHAFGGGGEFFQEFTDVKRERSTLTVGMVDKYGNVWQQFLERCIMYSMMHPDTKIPLTATLEGDGPTDLLADWYGGTIAFIEPDPTGKRAIRTWISTNVWPTTTGPIEGKMDKTSALSIKELSIDLTSLTFINEGTRTYGQELLNGINMTYANPHARESFVTEIAPDVAAVTKGYQESVETIGENHIDGVV